MNQEQTNNWLKENWFKIFFIIISISFIGVLIVQIRSKNIQIDKLNSYIDQKNKEAQEIKSNSPIGISENSAVKIEKCKILAESTARVNAVRVLHKAAEEAIANGDGQTAGVYLTADPKKVGSYQPDYENSYFNCLNKK